MSVGLPETIGPEDEISVTWEVDGGDTTTVVVALGGVEITLRTTPDAAETVPWLIAALPQALEAAYAAITATEEEA